MTVQREKTILKAALIGLVLVFIGIYGYSKTKDLIDGPRISVSSPEDGETLFQSASVISGTAKNVSFLSLNDRPIFVDKNGNFSETVALLPGYNILSVRGIDKFGKKTEKTLQLVLRETGTINN